MRVAAAATAAYLAAAIAPGAAIAGPGNGPLAPYRGEVVASLRQDNGSYRLALIGASKPAHYLKVAPRRSVFDVDTGTDAAGHGVAVYSRCATAANSQDGSYLPSWRTQRACRLYEYRFATGRERRLGAGSGSRFLPTIDRGNLAWAQTHDTSIDDDAPPPQLRYEARGRRSSRRLPGGSPFAREVNTTPVAGPQQLDLRGEQLAFAWNYRPERAACDRTGDAFPASEAWRVDVRAGRRKLLVRAGCPEDPRDLSTIDGVQQTPAGTLVLEQRAVADELQSSLQPFNRAGNALAPIALGAPASIGLGASSATAASATEIARTDSTASGGRSATIVRIQVPALW